MRYRSTLLPLLLVALTLSACRDDPTRALLERVHSVVVTPDPARVGRGATVQLTAEARDASGGPVNGAPVRWSSFDPSKATVSPTGLVTGLTPGAVHVEAQVGSVVTSVLVEVTTVWSVTLTQLGGALAGSWFTVDVTIRTPSGEQVVELSSSDTTVIRVPESVRTGTDGSARVHPEALRAGTAEIRARVDGHTDTLSVTVTAAVPRPLAGVRVDVGRDTLVAGDTTRVRGWPVDAAGNLVEGPPITFAVSHGGATVGPDGLVRVEKAGPVGVEARSGEHSETARLMVVPRWEMRQVRGPVLRSAPAPGDTFRLAVRVLDREGRPVPGATVGWRPLPEVSTLTPTSTQTDADGVATTLWRLGEWPPAQEFGSQSQGAMASTVTGRDTLRSYFSVTRLRPDQQLPGPPARISIRPDSATLAPGETLAATASVTDSSFRATAEQEVAWSSSAPGVAEVGPDGRVRALAPGSALITASVGAASASIPVTVRAPAAVREVAVGWGLACAVLESPAPPYCWGVNYFGGARLTPSPEPLPSSPSFERIWAGMNHACGRSREGAAWCWGPNDRGQLGTGTLTGSATPVRIAGGHDFVRISPSDSHTCAVTTDGRVYCWGNNDWGQFGNGEQALWQGPFPSPQPVRTELRFSDVAVGADHTCALTVGGEAWCWGRAVLGSSTPGVTVSLLPSAVAGGHRFTSVVSGADHACGVTAGGQAYCWGSNQAGQLGHGDLSRFTWNTPVPVAGGHRFIAMAAGDGVTCGLTGDGTAMCWGRNASGQLGNGSTVNSAVPAPVAGGHRFRHLDVGRATACGVTLSGEVYCWGAAESNLLGRVVENPGNCAGSQRCRSTVPVWVRVLRRAEG